MSVRYRLFLWVSGLFLLVAVFSYFLESYTTKRELKKAQEVMRQKLLGISEKRRQDLEGFLASAVIENEVKVDAVLSNVSRFSPEVFRFGPTMNNIEKGTWGGAAGLLLDYKWIDFLQNTNEGRVSATLVPSSASAAPAYRIDIDVDLSWIYLGDLKEHPDPYLAVRIPYSLVQRSFENPKGEIAEQTSAVVPEGFLLFDANALKASSKQRNTQPIFESRHWPPIPVIWLEGYELDLDPLVKAFQRAKEMLLKGQIKPPVISAEEVFKRMDGVISQQGGKFGVIPPEPLLSTVTTEKYMKQKLEEISLRYTQISMLWVLIALYDTGLFGEDLFSFPSPSGITLFSIDSAAGVGVNAKSVLRPQPLFDARAYYASHSSDGDKTSLGNSLAVIPMPDLECAFLGNAVQLIVKAAEEARTGYLTLGANADEILEKLVLAVQQTALLVHGGSVLSAYAPDGKKIPIAGHFELPFSQMLQQKTGIVPWNAGNYFFMHMQPFPKVDLHFFLLNPEAKEFAFLRDLEAGSQEVANAVLFDIHITGFVALFIAIISLHALARRMTRPIIQLAQATKEVGEGRLDQVQLNLPKRTQNDEIAVLCYSFEEMVKGLREKEKVQAVLNKVVSREIAEEILKGNIHLGGEEKSVTMLFADIRDFTKMTQNMPPAKIIDLLNACMTKIASVVDSNKGVIDKFVGDEAMALFGAPLSYEDSAWRAVKSAVEIIDALKKWNAERAAKSEPIIEMGIGIHTGNVLAGNMGAEDRLNYTVIGSSVNLAARLCSAAKRMEILITKDTLEQPFVKDRVVYEEMPLASFKGFDQTKEVYRVRGVH